MTKIMCLADLHLTDKKPPCRIDSEDWLSTVNQKLLYIARLAVEQNVHTVVIAGDVFDSVHKCGFEFMSIVLQWFMLFKKFNIKVIAIPGNHDLINNDHDRLNQTPFGTLKALELVGSPDDIGFGYMSYGAEDYSGKESIVVAHYGLWHKNRPFDSAPDAGNVEWFVNNKLPDSCKLFITGHFHVPFVVKYRDTVVVNCGCPFRMRADLIDYAPYVTIVRIEGNEVHPKKFPIPLTNDIRRDYIDDKKSKEVLLDELVGSIEGDFEAGFNFKDNFNSLIENVKHKELIIKEFERCANGFYK